MSYFTVYDTDQQQIGELTIKDDEISSAGDLILKPAADSALANHKDFDLSDAIFSIHQSITDHVFIDQQFFNSTPAVNGTDLWQSFTAGVDGYLTQIAMYLSSGNPPFDLRIHAGEGTAGTILALKSNCNSVFGWNTYSLEKHVYLKKDNQYTIRLSSSSDCGWRVSLSGGYGGGRFSSGASVDGSFRTYMTTESTDIFFERDSGKLGLNTRVLDEMLNVSGNIKFKNLVIELEEQGFTNPPTAAEIEAQLGTAAAAGRGFIARVKDHINYKIYTFFSDGSNWWYASAVQAV